MMTLKFHQIYMILVFLKSHMKETKMIADKETHENHKDNYETFDYNMTIAKQTIDISRTTSRCALYSYCRDAKNPVVFRHYVHCHGDSMKYGYDKKTHDYCKMYIFIEGKFNFLIEDNVCAPVCGNVITIRSGEKYTSA